MGGAHGQSKRKWGGWSSPLEVGVVSGGLSVGGSTGFNRVLTGPHISASNLDCCKTDLTVCTCHTCELSIVNKVALDGSSKPIEVL